jgi:galactitol-specific phosphotransferase system IIB component
MNKHNITFEEVKEEIEQLEENTKHIYELIIDITKLYDDLKSYENKMTCNILLIKNRMLIEKKISNKLKLYLSFCNPNLVN